MPLYFFHVTDGQTYLDHVGTELPGLDAARQEAFGTISDLLMGKDTWDSTEWQVTVTDANGQTLLKLRFSAEELSSPASS